MATAALPAWALETGACAAALALPHAVYALVWTRPTAFARASGAARHGPVAIAKQFATLAVGMKVIQLLFYLRWYLITIEGDESGDVGRLLVSTFSRAGATRLAAAAVLLCSGGSLNHAVYTTLGAVGVYYGNRFGAVIPWVEGYPFNVFPHPQYLGSILCLVGGMAAYHCMLYVITSIVETYIDGATADLSKAGSWSIAAPAEADKVVKATGRAGAAAGTRRAKARRD
eukprot:PRCOL_00005528-RA